MTFGNIIGIVTVYIVTGYPFLIHSAPLHHKYVVMCCLCHVDAMLSVLSVVYMESKEITRDQFLVYVHIFAISS